MFSSCFVHSFPISSSPIELLSYIYLLHPLHCGLPDIIWMYTSRISHLYNDSGRNKFEEICGVDELTCVIENVQTTNSLLYQSRSTLSLLTVYYAVHCVITYLFVSDTFSNNLSTLSQCPAVSFLSHSINLSSTSPLNTISWIHCSSSNSAFSPFLPFGDKTEICLWIDRPSRVNSFDILNMSSFHWLFLTAYIVLFLEPFRACLFVFIRCRHHTLHSPPSSIIVCLHIYHPSVHSPIQSSTCLSIHCRLSMSIRHHWWQQFHLLICSSLCIWNEWIRLHPDLLCDCWLTVLFWGMCCW